MRRERATRERSTPPDVVVELHGPIADDLRGYAVRKVTAVLVRADRRVLHARVRVSRTSVPDRGRPVTAAANIDLEGTLLRVRCTGSTPREAVDRLVDRLDERVRRAALHWEARRGRVFHGDPHEWRHGYPGGHSSGSEPTEVPT
jgi:ribosome-associated translation inhibitor RaiA